MTEKIVLLLGDISHEGLTSSLVTVGRSYRQKHLHSKVENWRSILRLFEEFQIVAVIGKFVGTTYDYLIRKDYDEVRSQLFARVRTVPHRIFLYEDLLNGTGDPNGQYSESYREYLESSGGTKAKELLRQGNEVLRQSGLDVFPYRKRAEVTLAAQTFLEDTEQGLIFRLYLPSGRLWESEVGRLLTLFKDYLTKVAGISVRLDQVSTKKGVIYAFHSHSAANLTPDLSSHFEDFSKLAELCVSHPEAASELLAKKELDPRQIAQIVTRYSKEVRRLQLDLRHSREEKLLSIRHRLESELTDVVAQEDQSLIDQVVDSVVPAVSASSRLPDLLLPEVGRPHASRSLTVNVRPQFINLVQGIVAQEISGNVSLSAQDKHLLALFQEHGGARTGELTSALHELNDESAPEAGRISAKQRINKFLIAIADKAGDVGAGILQTYIEKKLLGL